MKTAGANESTMWNQRRLGALFTLLAVCGLAACVDSGGDGDSFDGGSTVRGLVVSVNGRTDSVGNVGVTIGGTDLQTRTANDGLFVLSGVPPGTRDIQFMRDMTSGTLTTDVPANSTVELRNVRISNNQARADTITVTRNEAPDNRSLTDNSDSESGDDSLDDDSDDDSGGNSGPGGGADSLDDDPDADSHGGNSGPGGGS